jgi:RND superfamily putative drug exporter
MRPIVSLMFTRWGRMVYRFRWPTLVASFVLIALSVFLFWTVPSPTMTSPSSGLPTQSAHAQNLMDQQLPQTLPSFDLVLASSSLRTTDTAFQSAMQAALAPLQHDSRVSTLTTPYTVTAAQSAALRSNDGHQALAVVTMKGGSTSKDYAAVRAEVHSATLAITGTGQLAVSHDFSSYLRTDLTSSSAVVFPVAMLLLLLVFGALVAAGLPLLIAIAAEISGLAIGVNVLNQFTDVSQYATNLIALIGLGVAIDYSLFIVSRFREELAAGQAVPESVARSVGTAGRAITFSGITVAVGLCGLLFFQGSFLASMGAAAAIAVILAVIWALTFLPALLSVLGTRTNALRVPFPGRPPHTGHGLFHALATRVMRHPFFALVPALVLLAVLAAPVPNLSLAQTGIQGLPPQAESRNGFAMLQSNFPNQSLNNFTVVLDYGSGDPQSAQNLSALRTFEVSLSQQSGANSLSGPQFGSHIAVLTVGSHAGVQSSQANNLLTSIRGLTPPTGAHVLVTGATAVNADTTNYLLSQVPVALGFVMLATYVLLFLLLGSVVLPLKAVVTNLLSISAAFGALVFIFVQGNFSGFLNFTPQPVDPLVLALLFAVMYGLSMDYEVFLLSRIQEQYRETGDTVKAVAMGLERSGRLITGAAGIMIGVFLAFGVLAHTVFIKEIGIGLTIAVLVDATLVRLIVVPAIMRLLGRANWWAPKPLAQLHQRLGLGEGTASDGPPIRAVA